MPTVVGTRVMMPEMMGMMDGMRWAIGVIWLLVLILLVLGIGALAKYLFLQRRS